MLARNHCMSVDERSDGYYLAGLSTLSLRSFNSTEAVVQAILELIVDSLGLRTSYITHIDPTQDRNTVKAAYSRAGGADIRSGVDLQLHQTY